MWSNTGDTLFFQSMLSGRLEIWKLARAGGEAVQLTRNGCVGGLGRSGLVAACYLKAQGSTTPDPIASVRAARSPRAVESAQQEDFVARYRD